MCPRSHNESLIVLRLRQRNKSHIRCRSGPRVVPAADVIHGNVLVFRNVIDDAGAEVLPIVVEIAVVHCVDEPRFVIGCELQRCCTGAQRQSPHIFIHVFRSFFQGMFRTRIAERFFAAVACTVGENPVEETQLERAIVAESVVTGIRNGVNGNHRRQKRSARDSRLRR